MQLDQVKQAIVSAPKGANIVVEWLRPCKTFKGVTDTVTKAVRMVGRIGVEYDNLSAVQAKRESGDLPVQNQGLNGMEWVEAPYLLKAIKSGRYLIRLYNGTSASVHPEVHFFVNGIEVEKDELFSRAQYLLASEKTPSHGDCFSCHTDDITRIHTEAEWHMLVVGSVGQVKADIPVPAKVVATMV